jgi:hypothetical protein
LKVLAFHLRSEQFTEISLKEKKKCNLLPKAGSYILS